ncbi:MAG: hypothetical protein KGO02_20290 [Alphaproteobacteria bacterium]|nr:hypothetical protein [Alphaproteobacteria bacterium]
MTAIRGSRAQARSKSEFFASLNTALRIYGPAREMCRFTYESFEESTYQPNVAAKVVGLAFLSAVAAWEDFVEEVYLGYLCGYPAPNGHIPKLRVGPAQNKTHAMALAAGESNEHEAARKLKWGNFKWVQALSFIHFSRDNVFANIAAADVTWLDLAQIVRNRVAHNSDKAKAQYKTALNRLLNEHPNSPLPRGFGPGKFLIYTTDADQRLRPLMQEDHHWPDVFEGYVSLWSRLADDLCPEGRPAE